jgi:hypothetical protein
MTVIVRHDIGCPPKLRDPFGGHSDAAKRVSDQWKLHRVALGNNAIGKWFAARLADGTSDGVLYDTKQDAIRHQHHNEVYFAFICIAPTDISVCDADVYLRTLREMYDAGIRMTDPADAAGGRAPILRQSREDQVSLARSIASRGRVKPSNLEYPSRPD